MIEADLTEAPLIRECTSKIGNTEFKTDAGCTMN